MLNFTKAFSDWSGPFANELHKVRTLANPSQSSKKSDPGPVDFFFFLDRSKPSQVSLASGRSEVVG